MSVYSFVRKTSSDGHFVGANQGSPSLCQLIESEFPEYSFRSVSVGEELQLVFEVDLSSEQVLALEAVYDSWSPNTSRQYSSLFRIEDKPIKGRVLVVRYYEEYDEETEIPSKLAKQETYNWSKNVLESISTTEYYTDGSIARITVNPLYTTASGLRVTKVVHE